MLSVTSKDTVSYPFDLISSTNCDLACRNGCIRVNKISMERCNSKIKGGWGLLSYFFEGGLTDFFPQRKQTIHCEQSSFKHYCNCSAIQNWIGSMKTYTVDSTPQNSQPKKYLHLLSLRSCSKSILCFFSNIVEIPCFCRTTTTGNSLRKV